MTSSGAICTCVVQSVLCWEKDESICNVGCMKRMAEKRERGRWTIEQVVKRLTREM